MLRKSLGFSRHLGMLAKPAQIMGIVNVTPDSFSDGSLFFNPSDAIEHGKKLIAEGAHLLDIGGVSTAPNRPQVLVVDELKRVLPVIEGLRLSGITNLSVDTRRACVAKAALDRGATWINDQSAGLFDPDMPAVMAKAKGVVIMHDGKGGNSGVEAGEGVIYDDVIKTILLFFESRISALSQQGVDPKRIVVDPGIGFGKGLKDSLTIINNMHRFKGMGARCLIGLSRKSFLGESAA